LPKTTKFTDFTNVFRQENGSKNHTSEYLERSKKYVFRNYGKEFRVLA